MMLNISFLIALYLNICAVSYAAPSPTLARRDAPPPPLSTACGDIVRNASENTFKASLVYDCLTSVPFNPAVATKFLKYYKDSVQFQSTVEYLKKPPPSYQQPAFDLLGNLDLIQGLINTNQFGNQYEFEAALQSVVYGAHDDHLSLTSGILGVFSFGTSYRIVSLSKDGIELPKVYLSADIVLNLKDKSFAPSPIVKLDGQDATKYLTHFAALNAVGGRESHTDWNSLMINPAQVIQGMPSLWGGGGTFYPGKTLKIELLNGTKFETPWYGVFHGDSETGPLETGGDFYNSFVLGFWPADFEPEEDEEEEPVVERAEPSTTSRSVTPASTTTSLARPTVVPKWNNVAYPKPDLAQEGLGQSGGGVLSAYFLKDASVAVLSVPSFSESDEAIDLFSDFVGTFIKTSKAKGMKKLVIDLQRNFGGDALLATDMYRQFFPKEDKKPFAGSRMRGHGPANVMGKTLTDYWKTTTEKDEDYVYLYSNEWVALTRINAETDKTFTSWEEFYGSRKSNGGNVTTTQRYNFADALFDTIATGSDEPFVVYGYGNRPVTTQQEYAAEDIILLTDGLCSSTCSLFVEMMHQEAGVRTVVAGGRPSYGPMQAVGLSRGAIRYSVKTQLDSDIADTKTILEFNKQTNDIFPGRAEGLDVELYFAGVNLRDQIRKGDDVPLQFKYDAADCRIFFTPQSIFNFTNLWLHAASAIWTKPELCTKDSTGYATTSSTNNKLPPSTLLPESSLIEAPHLKFSALITSFISPSGAIQAKTLPKGDKLIKPKPKPKSSVGKDCRALPLRKDVYGDPVTDQTLCPANYYCDPAYVFCSEKEPAVKVARPGCVKRCYDGDDPACAGDGCYTIPDVVLQDLDDTTRGYCSARVKRKAEKCTKSKNTSVKPDQPPTIGSRK